MTVKQKQKEKTKEVAVDPEEEEVLPVQGVDRLLARVVVLAVEVLALVVVVMVLVVVIIPWDRPQPSFLWLYAATTDTAQQPRPFVRTFVL